MVHLALILIIVSFNQEEALVGTFSVIVKSFHNLREPSFEALMERGERESGERGDDINISNRSREI